jgi:NMD protein affecting ribosome stability and mRNA decay
MKYQVNRGKICQEEGCENKARIKGLCMNCYSLKRQNILKKQ